MNVNNIQTIITHADCADGIASALILKDVLPDARILFVQYNTPAHRDLPAEPGMLFCDMTPPASRVQEFVDAGAIVLDHHKGARELVEAFGERGIFADEAEEPGVCGAVLAFREFWLDRWQGYVQYIQRVSLFAELAGVRDTWQRLDPRWRAACAQAAALKFWPTTLLLEEGLSHVLDRRLDIGEILLQRDEERDTKTINEAYRFSAGPVRVAAFEGLHTSDIADRLEGEVDLVLGWHYLADPKLGPRLTVSCRSRGDFSALDFARANGGGGHAQAAGFSIDAPAEDPYEAMRRLVRGYAENTLTTSQK